MNVSEEEDDVEEEEDVGCCIVSKTRCFGSFKEWTLRCNKCHINRCGGLKNTV